MKIQNLLLPVLGAGLALTLMPVDSEGFVLNGDSLGTGQRDLRCFNNFADSVANNNTNDNPEFPGYDGAEMAMWKAAVEWGSRLHGQGTGDPHQSGGLGSGGANFDPTWQGNATAIGGTNNNIASALSSNGGGVLAFAEGPYSDGWRVRFLDGDVSWADGPGSNVGNQNFDIQGVMAHEYGHCLGFGHSASGSATMFASTGPNNAGDRSISSDDIAGLQAIYGVADFNTKPIISGVALIQGQMTITGANFAQPSNEVWFTQAGAGGNGTAVKVLNVPSPDQSTIVINVPANAGPGDVLVKKPGANGSISNAWPVDPTSSICPDIVYSCQNPANQTGFPTQISVQGSTSFSANDITFIGTPVGVGNSGLVAYSPDTTSMPLGDGTLCLGSSSLGFVLRLAGHQPDAFGNLVHVYDNTMPPLPAGQVTVGSTWHYQWWHRNFVTGGSGFIFSNMASITFCP